MNSQQEVISCAWNHSVGIPPSRRSRQSLARVNKKKKEKTKQKEQSYKIQASFIHSEKPTSKYQDAKAQRRFCENLHDGLQWCPHHYRPLAFKLSG